MFGRIVVTDGLAAEMKKLSQCLGGLSANK